MSISKCKKCGSNIPTGYKFCSNCGAPVENLTVKIDKKNPKNVVNPPKKSYKSTMTLEAKQRHYHNNSFNHKNKSYFSLKTIMGFVVFLLLTIGAIYLVPKIINSLPQQSTTSGNLANGGLFATHKGWTFFVSTSHSGNIFKFKEDIAEAVLINNDDSWLINISEDWIYYSNLSDGGKIYKIRTNGEDRVKLNEDESTGIIVWEDWIYYSNLSDGGKIYKIRTNGEDRVKLNEDESWSINVSDGWVYYRNRDEGYKIYKVRLDGSERTQVNEDDSMFINIQGSTIYYRSLHDGKFYSIGIDGSNRKKLQ
jgi:hypothetical protein